MGITKYLVICCLSLGGLAPGLAFSAEPPSFGPLYDEFPLTLAPGHRTEILGPLFYSEQKETQHQWGFPPLGMSHTLDPAVDYEEFDLVYPVLTYDRFGKEYRWQLFQFFSFAGGQTQSEADNHRFTLFPIYFRQRSTNTNLNYTAVVPFYGHLKNRLFRDEIDFVMFPFYSKTRKQDIVTRNMPYPFFHLRTGTGLTGMQFLPFYGREHKNVYTFTNNFGDPQLSAGHDSRFIMWPFFTQSTNDIGTDNPVRQQALIPIYSLYRSKLRDSTTYFWPLGVTHTVNREKNYVEWDAPWPLIEFARGEGKTTSRVWPFFSQSHNQYVKDNWYLWPVYKYNRLHSDPLDRERTRILFFLYSDTIEKNTETHKSRRRTDLFGFFTHQRDFNGDERLQVVSILESIYPASKSIERDYPPLYAFWRSEKSPRLGTASQSLLWNLYRRSVTPETKKISLLFGLFQYQSSPEGRRWRVCYVPLGHVRPPASGSSAPH